MKINKLLNGINILESRNAKDLDIENINYHSGNIKENGLFVCIVGYKTDGHKYAESAIKNGATALVVEYFLDLDVPQYKVEDARKALAIIGDNFYDHPSQEINLIGITATNGKTTTSFMLKSIFDNMGIDSGIIGTVFLKYGDVKIPSILTTPQSLDLHYHLRQMLNLGIKYAIMEVSSSGIEADRVHGVDFNIRTFNNMSREHIDEHGSFESYKHFKTSFIRDAKTKDLAILNLDDEVSKSLLDDTDAKTFTYGIDDKSGNISVSDLDLSTGYGKFRINYLGEKYEVRLSVPGYHNVYNSLVAISVAINLGIPMQDIISGIAKFKGIERRFELIYDHDFKIIDDHFANRGNIEMTLKTLGFMKYNKMHVVYAIRGSRGYVVNKENAELMVEWFEKLGIKDVIATKSIDCVSEKDRVTDEEEEVFLKLMKENSINVRIFDKLDDATKVVSHEAGKGDLVLLAGCQGMDYGCNMVLNHLEKIKDIDVKELRKPLENRTAGILE